MSKVNTATINVEVTSEKSVVESIMEDIRSRFFWREVVTEFFATMLFIMNVVLVVTMSSNFGTEKIVVISLAIGLSVAILAHVFGPLCGANMNPAVTLALLVKGEMHIVKAVLYLAVQLTGGIAGAALARSLIPANQRGTLATMKPAPDMSLSQAFFTEMMLTMLLDYTVLASISNDNGRKDFGFANALAIGLSVSVAHLVGIPLTGAGINPARAFGPSVVTGIFPSSHWVYWLGPLAGAIICGLTYRSAFSPEPLKKNSSGSDFQLNDVSNA